MMHPMLRRGDNDVLQKAELANVLGMIPHLCKLVNGQNHHDNYRRKPKQGSWQRQKEEKVDVACKGLAYGSGNIVLFRIVVDEMAFPKKIDLMMQAMSPVKLKIEHHKGDGID
jgi:hypothetical protein